MHVGRFPLKWPRSPEGVGGTGRGCPGVPGGRSTGSRAGAEQWAGREACLRSRSNHPPRGLFSKAQLLQSNRKVGPAAVSIMNTQRGVVPGWGSPTPS